MKKIYSTILILSFLTFFVKGQDICDKEFGAAGNFSESILTGESVSNMAGVAGHVEAVTNFTEDKIMTERKTQILQETSVIPKFLQTTITETSRSMSCMPGSTYSNAPENYINVINSNIFAGYRGAQRITGFEYPIGAIRIFGIQSIYQNGYIPAEHVDPLNFELKFFADNEGVPGDEITDLSEEVLLTHNETGVMFASDFNVFYWDYEPENPIEGLPDIFWISFSNTNTNSWFMWLDAIGGQDESMQQEKVFGRWSPNDNPFALCLVPVLPEPGAPGKPTDLNAVAADLGALAANISWVNPTETFSGETLENLDKITLEVNGDIVKEYSNPVIGGDVSYEFTAAESGNYKFLVYGTNSEGDGAPVNQTIWVGADLPAAPQNVVLEAVGNGGKITWDAPVDGLNGGYLDVSKTVYTVIRLPETILAENISATEYFDNSINRIANYQYKIIASNDIGEGGEALSNIAPLGAEGILFFEDFTFVPVGELPQGWVKEGEQAADWAVRNTFQAGYEPPELRLDHGPYFNGLSRLVTHSFGAEGNKSLRLRFGHFFSFFGGDGHTLAVQVSFDDGDWNNLWRKDLTRDFGPEEVECYFAVPDGATSMRLGLEFDGNINSINYYSFDNAIVEPVVDNDLTATSISGNPTPPGGRCYSLYGNRSECRKRYAKRLHREADEGRWY